MLKSRAILIGFALLLPCFPMADAQAQLDDLFFEATDQSLLPSSSGTDDLQSSTQLPDVDIGASLERTDSQSSRPFGWEIFDSSALGSNVARPTGINPDYIVSPGDRIVVQLWGAQVAAYELTVDAQGNIFIPEAGPIQVSGLRQANLDAAINHAVNAVFTEQVQAYTNLLGTQPIGVYVTGAVARPSLYAGDRRDSPLYFLAQSGGIDLDRGSFRDITVIRDGNVIASIDLYDFLLKGYLPTIQFANNDTILVGPLKSSITISGSVRNAYTFEITEPLIDGREAMNLAGTEPSATNVIIRGVRNNVPFNAYMSLAEFASQPVHDGDTLIVESDLIEDTLFVSVVGHASGPSAYSVLRGTRLTEVLDAVAVDPMVADLDAIYLQRTSVAESQKAALQRALDELQRTVLTATSASPSQAQIRVAEAQLIRQFIDRARHAEPEGRVYLGGNPAETNLLLEDGDLIVIPQQSDLVMISGEVRLPQTTVYNKDYDLSNYVEQSGGYSDRADSSAVLVLRLGGEVLHEADPEIRPGDHILVLPSAGDKTLALIKDLVEIVFRTALSTGIVIDIFDD